MYFYAATTWAWAGLASLIPQKKTSTTTDTISPSASSVGDGSSSPVNSQGSSKTVLASPFLGSQQTKISPSSYKKEGNAKTLADVPKSESSRKPSALDNLSAPKEKLSNTVQEKPIAATSLPKKAASKAVYDVPIEPTSLDSKSENSSVTQKLNCQLKKISLQRVIQNLFCKLLQKRLFQIHISRAFILMKIS